MTQLGLNFLLGACMSVAVLCLAVEVVPRSATAASLDPSFGDGGTVVFETGSTNGARIQGYAGPSDPPLGFLG